MESLRLDNPSANKLIQDAEQTLSRLQKEFIQSPVNMDKLTIGQVKTLNDKAKSMDADQLETWAAELPAKSAEEKQAAAIIFTNEALEQNRGNQKQVLSAALMADPRLTSEIAKVHLSNMHEEISKTSGDIAGVLGTMFLKEGIERTLESAAAIKLLPLSPIIKTAVSMSAGLAIGAAINNYAAGRDLVDSQGFYRNSALSGILFASSFAAGAVILPASSGTIWQRAGHTYTVSSVAVAQYSLCSLLGLRMKTENFEKSLASARWLENWRVETNFIRHTDETIKN